MKIETNIIIVSIAIIILAITNIFADNRITVNENKIKELEGANEIQQEQIYELCRRVNELEMRQSSTGEEIVEAEVDIYRPSLTLESVAALSKEYVPNENTKSYLYMDYDCITAKSSAQYKLQNSGLVYTSDSGLRIYDNGQEEFILVALGYNYGTDIGDTWTVTLDNGSVFKIMLGDCKDDVEYGHWSNDKLNMIEFIVDTDCMPRSVRRSGTYSTLDFFDGQVKSIEYLGREWEC